LDHWDEWHLESAVEVVPAKAATLRIFFSFKVDKLIAALICNLTILAPIPRGAHIFLEVCACFVSQTQVKL